MTEFEFQYLFAGDPNTTMPELLPYHGQRIAEIRDAPTEEYDFEETGPMYIVKFSDGFEAWAFSEEINRIR